jgi:chromosome segregation ATPase
MAELDAITKTLRRQRKDLDDLREKTSTRGTETSALLEKIEELRARAERSTTAYESQGAESDSKKSK